MATKPSILPRWASTLAAQILEPTSGAKDTGWLAGERPTAQTINWLFNNLYQWATYLDEFLSTANTWVAVQTFNSILSHLFFSGTTTNGAYYVLLRTTSQNDNNYVRLMVNIRASQDSGFAMSINANPTGGIGVFQSDVAGDSMLYEFNYKGRLRISRATTGSAGATITWTTDGGWDESGRHYQGTRTYDDNSGVNSSSRSAPSTSRSGRVVAQSGISYYQINHASLTTQSFVLAHLEFSATGNRVVGIEYQAGYCRIHFDAALSTNYYMRWYIVSM